MAELATTAEAMGQETTEGATDAALGQFVVRKAAPGEA